MTETRSDVSLARDALRGDEGAFEDLVHRYERVVYNAAWRLTGNTDDARDISQNVFLKVYQGLGSYDPSHAFYSWLYRITINEALNFNGARRGTEPLDGLDLESPSPRPDEHWERSERRGRVETALAVLSADYRVVIVLKHILGCSYEEMAEITGVPEKTIKSRLFTARQQLKRELAMKGVV